jgi:hypothetical protein
MELAQAQAVCYRHCHLGLNLIGFFQVTLIQALDRLQVAPHLLPMATMITRARATRLWLLLQSTIPALHQLRRQGPAASTQPRQLPVAPQTFLAPNFYPVSSWVSLDFNSDTDWN